MGGPVGLGCVVRGMAMAATWRVWAMPRGYCFRRRLAVVARVRATGRSLSRGNYARKRIKPGCLQQANDSAQIKRF